MAHHRTTSSHGDSADLDQLPTLLEKTREDSIPDKDSGGVGDVKSLVDSVTDSHSHKVGGTRFVNGEPVITTGEDVSNYAVDVRDDGDEALTFRSFVLGTVVAGLGASLAEVSLPSS